MEKYFVKARNAVCDKLGREYEYFSLVTLGLCAALYKYKDYENEILKLFKRLEIYIDDDYVGNIIKKNKIARMNFDDEDEEIRGEHLICTSGLSYAGRTCNLYKNKAVAVYTNPILICDACFNSVIVLNTFMHEFNHLIKSIVNGFELYNEEDRIGFSIRTGIEINTTLFNTKKRATIDIIDFSTFDEAINVLETCEMSESLLMLDGIIPDKDVLDFYNGLDKDKLCSPEGYENVISLFKPLWDNKYFHDLIEDNIVEGNLNEIITGYENIMGENSFEDFAILLDDYDDETSMYDNPLKIDKLENSIISTINKFNELTKFVYKK